MNCRALRIKSILALVLMLPLALFGPAGAQEPWPNDQPPEPAPEEEPAGPYGSGEEGAAVDILPALALDSVASLTNGDFETGDLSGWGLHQAGSTNGWSAYSGTVSPESGHTIAAPPQGTYAAVSDQSEPNVQILYQDITLPAAPCINYDLSFILYYHNWWDAFYTPATLDYTGDPNQQYRVDIMDPTAPVDSVAPGDVLANVFQTQVGDPFVLPPTPVTFNLSPFAGQTVRLRFAEVDNQGNFNASVDDVQLTLRTPVTNGDFETGDLSGWGLHHAGDTQGWSAYSGTVSPESGQPIAAPPQGTYAAVSDQTFVSVDILYQDITLPAAPCFYDLDFILYYHNWWDAFYTPATLDYTGGQNQQYRVDIMDPTAPVDSVAPGDVLANVFQTQVGDPLVLPPTPVTFNLGPFAGQTVRLRFAGVQTHFYFNASVDDVQLTPRGVYLPLIRVD